VEGFSIRAIELKSKRTGNYAYVISIPKAGKNGPHQSDDKIYHKRHDATKLPMNDNEVRDMIGRSLEFGKKFGIAWDLMVEMRRIVAAAAERINVPPGDYLPRASLSIAVSSSLRSSGIAIMSLPRPLRASAAKLIQKIDEYNSIVETVDPGHGEKARLNNPLREHLKTVVASGGDICAGLLDVLKDEP
jgi:hypothetical protein